VFLVVVALTFGRGGRGFFSPDTLETKTQREHLIPVVNIPIWRSSFQVHRQELVTFLISEGYWSPTANDSPRWIIAFHWNDQWRDGETRLHRELSRGEDWIAWTKEHPLMAEVIWPQLIDVLQDPTASPATAGTLMRCAYGASDLKEYERFARKSLYPDEIEHPTLAKHFPAPEE
jgi:hypothetical protein